MISEKDRKNFILLAEKLDWNHQGTLLKAEDKFIEQKEIFYIRIKDTEIARYLKLGSLPFVFQEEDDTDEMAANLRYEMQIRINRVWPDAWLDLRNSRREEYNGRLPTLPRGNLQPVYMIIGDAPGRGLSPPKFDRTMTFGPSSHILRKAMIFCGKHYQTWYTNLVKVSQKNNQPTTNSEVLAWKKYLDTEIDELQPKHIILLGNHVFRMFNQFYLGDVDQKITIDKIYHPSHISRNHIEYQVYGDQIRETIRKYYVAC